MSEQEPTLKEVLDTVNELRGEVGEVRIGLGDMRGRLERLDRRLDALTGEGGELRATLSDQEQRLTEHGRRFDGIDGLLDVLTGEVEGPGPRDTSGAGAADDARLVTPRERLNSGRPPTPGTRRG